MSDLTTLVREHSAARSKAFLRHSFADVMLTAHVAAETLDFEQAYKRACVDAGAMSADQQTIETTGELQQSQAGLATGMIVSGVDVEFKGELYSMFQMNDDALMRAKMAALVDLGIEYV
jgi:hypothetical protein